MSDQLSLLEDFKPVLRYDSNEGYFADSAAEMTDAEGNVLRSAAGEAIAEPGEGAEELNLGFLTAGEHYPNGSSVSDGDVLSVRGRDYLKQYREIRARSGYANVIYGRVKEVHGATWLQYWFWFFYNDLRALDVGLGLHEGDWEGVQLRMGDDGPDLAVYAQTRTARRGNGQRSRRRASVRSSTSLRARTLPTSTTAWPSRTGTELSTS